MITNPKKILFKILSEPTACLSIDCNSCPLKVCELSDTYLPCGISRLHSLMQSNALSRKEQAVEKLIELGYLDELIGLKL